ncbi:sulfatase family protein [Roseibacillus persicicus]|uniref:Heparan N-sulfatase n=1 Tax=Roseibacillus persicicus TaxID=454148 RepID=A0A918WFU5_9BACT|nr:sulfatase [Roseibacillus persicicus]GHC42454.1 heparan N-sulfatase [Roseibacillus persicicus]
MKLIFSLILSWLLTTVFAGADDLEDFSSLKDSRPNVIFFLGDDQSRFNHSTYGHPSIPTPVTEAFAKESLVFENAFTGQAICAPSRTMLYTGLYPIRNGCFMNHTQVRPGIETLPTLLGKLGYSVILAGKSHVSPDRSFPWSQRFSPVPKPGASRKWIPLQEIDKFLTNPGDKPFCLIVASEFPHAPFMEKTSFSPEEVVLPPYAKQSEAAKKEATHYYANVEQKELEFSALLELLDKHKQSEDSLVLYADDHGLERGKFTSYDSGLKVAFMARWPGRITPGRTKALVSFADFVPTVIELAGGTPEGFDGKSLLPIFSGQNARHHDYVYGVTVNQGTLGRHVFPQRSIHDGRFHYIHNFNTLEKLSRDKEAGKEFNFFLQKGAARYPRHREEMLFDTQTDPHELTNIANNPEYVKIKDDLKAKLFRWMKEQNDYLSADGPIPFLETKERFTLDKFDERNPIPPQYRGSLKGQKINPHSATQAR